MKGKNQNHASPSDDLLLDQDARAGYDAALDVILRRSHDETMKAGTGAKAYFEYNQWDYLKTIVADIQNGVPVDDEDSEIVAIGGVFADFLREGWTRYRAVRLDALKAKGGTAE